jgi:hypothetical protein
VAAPAPRRLRGGGAGARPALHQSGGQRQGEEEGEGRDEPFGGVDGELGDSVAGGDRDREGGLGGGAEGSAVGGQRHGGEAGRLGVEADEQAIVALAARREDPASRVASRGEDKGGVEAVAGRRRLDRQAAAGEMGGESQRRSAAGAGRGEARPPFRRGGVGDPHRSVLVLAQGARIVDGEGADALAGRVGDGERSGGGPGLARAGSGERSVDDDQGGP